MKKTSRGFVGLLLCAFVAAAVIWHLHNLATRTKNAGQVSVISQSTQNSVSTSDLKSTANPDSPNNPQQGPTLAKAKLLKQKSVNDVNSDESDRDGIGTQNVEGREEEAKDEDEGSAGAREGWFYEQREYPLT